MVELDLDELRRRLAGAGVTDVDPLAGGASSLTFRGARAGRAVVVKVAPPGVARGGGKVRPAWRRAGRPPRRPAPGAHHQSACRVQGSGSRSALAGPGKP